MHWQLRDSMRERTPSADDTPKRAPPAPPREASSADVVGGRGTGAEASPIARFSSPTANNIMVASTHNLGELVLGQYRLNTSERQLPVKNHHHHHYHHLHNQQQHQHHHHFNHHHHNSNNSHNHHSFYNQYHHHQPATSRPGQTDKDKRSRLSNVINNLRRKVPETNNDSGRSDERNSVERDLETLEKYVMTVLNGVIKDAETEGRGRVDAVNGIDAEDSNRYNANSIKEDVRNISESDCNDSVVNHEPLEPSAIEPAIPECDKDVDKSSMETVEMVDDTSRNDSDEISSIIATKDFDLALDIDDATLKHLDSRDTLMNINNEIVITTNIGDKLNDDIRSICRDVLNDLLSDISQAIDTSTIEMVETNCDESITMASLHCSLPLDKVAPVLPPLIESHETMSNAKIQIPPKSSPKSTSPTVRHLCLYCDRKFLSISLRQRHTERVHQLGGGRRSSERNSRKTIPSCQYCSDKCVDNLDGLFQHMIACHTDKYHACTQCNTRYSTREALLLHTRELHTSCDRISESLDRSKELVVVKEPHYSTRDVFIQNTRDIVQQQQQQEKAEDGDRRSHEHEPSQPVKTTPIKLNMFSRLPNKSKDISNPGSPDFDVAFYSSVSCNIRENLLHHLDGKLQDNINNSLPLSDPKPQQHNHQLFHEPANQTQLPIDISLTAATPVESKEYSTSDNCDNTSEYAQKAGKMSRLHPRRVSFEKYNFPRKYDGKEQWTCSINDLSKFDIYTQLTLSEKQKMIKENKSSDRSTPAKSESGQTDLSMDTNEIGIINVRLSEANDNAATNYSSGDNTKGEFNDDNKITNITQFSGEFGNFMQLRRWDECPSGEMINSENLVHAELTGEWSRPRIYICGACTSRHLTLKEMEDHKIFAHPNVWCSHLEFTGDQRELYKHLFLPGRSVPTMKAKNAVLHEKICTKCSKVCGTLAELHRHMLECGGDQAWLLGLFGNGKKKCKWRPFGSRSRRRRQRGMKRNISNSQGTPRVNTPKEKAPSGPRVRPSDRESIQKMLANLPAKRSTRRVIQDANSRCRLRKVQTRSRPHLTDNTTNTRLSRKTVLRNKLLKNAKSFQRKRCRGDNISAAIESVIINYKLSDASKRTEDKKENNDNGIDDNKEIKRKRQLDNSKLRNATALNTSKNVQSRKMINRVRVVSKKRNVKMETRKSNLKSIEKNLSQNSEELSSSSSSSSSSSLPSSLSSTSSSSNNSNAKSVKVGLKRSTKDALNVANSQSKARANVPNAVSTLSGDNITTRKRKSCDPLMSLNASIKAKSQLRSQDGKFVRNNLRNDSTQSDSSSNVSIQKIRTRTTRSDPGPLASRLRLRTTARSNAELSKRITRVSSDSDKMPTLELVDGAMIDEEDIEPPVDDLPILSPAILANRSCLKASDNSSTKQSDIKTRGKRGNISPKKLDKVNKQNSNVELPTEGKDDVDIEREVETKNRKSLRRRVSINVEVDDSSQRHESLRESKSRDDNSDVNRKSFKPEQLLASSDKKNLTSKVAATRKARQKRRAGSLEELSQLQQVPLEVKKLLGPKDDLLTQIGITPTAKIRRNLRQLSQTPKQKINITKKSNKLCDEDNNKDHISCVDTTNEKNILRKSPRIEKKESTPDVGLSDKLIIANKNDSKDYKPTLCNADTDNQLTAIITTQNNVPGRSRRRRKISVSSDNTISTIKLAPDHIEPTMASTNRSPNFEENETEEDQDDDEDQEELELTPEDKELNSGNDTKVDDNVSPKDILSVESVSLSFEDLQQESSNSNIDSGKENSSETPVNISKPRVTRPKKSRGLKRDRVVKRTLNNVIGILTEGVNIPVEVQQSVVLTVQTSIDNINSNNGLQNNRIEIGDNGIAASNGGGSNIDAIIDENNDDNCNTILDTAVDDGNGESASQELQRCANPLIEAKEEAKLDVKQDVNIECSVSNVTSNNVVHIDQQPTNDIILDLSRRKPRGKGSFLEKIVSKIAKQKDALLEGEVGSLIDHAVDELSIILGEVGPTLVDTPNDASKPPLIVSDSNENKNDNIIAEEKLVPPNEIIGGTMKVDENLSSFNPEPFNNPSLELNSVNDEIPLERVQNSDNVCSDRNSKKRSLDISSETKNKRKSVEEEELEDNRIEEDLCLADIMKLINTAKRESPVVNELHEEKVRPGKRKIADEECDTNDDRKDDEETSSSLYVGNDCHVNATEMNKKSKRSDDRKGDEKIDVRSEIARRSSSRRNKSNDNLPTEVADNKLDTGNNEIGKNNLVTSESNSETSFETTTPSVENDLSNIDCQVTLVTINKKPTKSKRRSKKKSIVSEQLCLAADKSVTELKVQSTDNETRAQDDIKCTEVSGQVSTQKEVIEDVRGKQVATAEEDTSSSPKKSFKIPEVLDAHPTTKKRGRKKSLANEHLAVVDVKISTAQTDSNQTIDSEDCRQDESVFETSDVCDTSCNNADDNSTKSETIAVKNRRSSKRKNNEAHIISPAISSTKEDKKIVEDNSKKTDETLIERRKTLKRKAKENIFLLDDVIDFGDDMDSPIPLPSEIIEDPVTEMCDQEINSEKSVNEMASHEHNCPLELPENPPEEIDSQLVAPKSQNVENGNQESENAATDDAASRKKRGSGNFAVVHTKSGEILIVEKKKKFTKEQAKFFCDICTTSFTRKSSLKKHNQSQSHLMQVTKFGSDQEVQDESISIDDTTVSSVDRSEMTNNEDRQDTAVDISKEETVEQKNENISERKETGDEKKEEVEFSSQSIQATPAVEKPSTPIVDSTVVESTFSCPHLEEDFEDELLDEEICKITENMTHDEYVLTDHVSPLPEGTSLSPLKDPIDSLLEASQTVEGEQKKTNLANEHLDLESPVSNSQVIQAEKVIAEKLLETPENNSPLLSELKYGHEAYKNINSNLNVSYEKRHETQQLLDDPKISLDFSNITEKLKINEFTTNNRKTPTEIDDFDSDEDLSATNMSRDIHKLLNETELNIDEKIDENETTDNVDNLVEVSHPIQCEDSLSNIEIEKQIITNETKSIKKKKERRVDSNDIDTSSRKSHQDIDSKEIISESNRKSSKSIEKSNISKSKSRKSKSLKKKVANDMSSDSDDDDDDGDDDDQEDSSSSQNKGKIVKSVFGRVLASEKVDKVKEVLDDWVSRSDSESRDDARPSSHTNTWNNWKDERKSKHEKSRSKSTSQRKKNNSSTVSATVTSSTEFNELSGNSRCRQSKKRAEERISRAFEEESIPYEFAYELEQQTESIKNSKESTIYYKESLEDSLKSLDSKKSRDQIDNDCINFTEIHDKSGKNNPDCEISQPEEFLFPDTNSMESIRTQVLSCPRERSSTPDIVSLTTRDSDNDAENGTDMENDDDNDDEDNNENDHDNDDEDDGDIVRGRLSPLYASNLAESSVDSVVSNSNEDKSNRVEYMDATNKRRSSSEFSGEKIVIRSTVSSEESHAGVVTIAPTDAIEDNALDVPQETQESTQKSRQGKVLNFDEELFVECCSRLKATTENELRGAKKIKLDHNEGGGGGSAGGYHSKDDQGIRTNRGRWRDNDNQNSLGSLLESVNQLLGEEMYNNREHHKRERNLRCERISPVAKVQTDFIRPENVGYEDSLDVAFEHNNKLRDKIQQRMRESENLITTSFSHVSNDNDRHRSHHHHHHHRHVRHQENVYHSTQREHNKRMFDDNERNIENMKDANQLSRHVSLESSTIKNEEDSSLNENSTMPYLLDKALSSLFHNDAKHDHNGSTPMNVLAELACAQVPTSTHTDIKLSREKLSRVKTLSNDLNDSTSTMGVQHSVDKIDKDQPKKTRNPIKELFERKNEINDRKHHHEKSHSLNSDKDCIISKQKTKKTKRHNDFPLIKNNEFSGGLVERKKRRDDRKRESMSLDKIKDIYDFDEEESQIEYAVNPAIPYRRKNEKNCEDISNTKLKDITFSDLMTKTITKTLENGHCHGHTDKRLERMIERKFHEIESVTPKTKGALKAYHVEEKRQSITGPMDEYIERRGRPRRTTEQSNKHNKSKKRSKNSKKRSRTAWYENDSSDEFVTPIKSVDIGVGISKSQRTCSKGKQNLFAELSTSSESEYEENEVVHQLNNKFLQESRNRISPEIADNYPQEHENHSTENWLNVSSKTESKNDIEHKKSESDMSDHPLIIDERKDCDDQQNNSGDETDNRSEPAFELDDLYREDSSVIGSDCEENNSVLPPINEIATDHYRKDENSGKDELIPLEEALDLLDNSENIEKMNDFIESATAPQTDNLILSDKFSESLDENEGECDEINVNGNNDKEQLNIDDEQESMELPEKLSSNEKPEPKASDNLPLHVFLSRKVQESKKRKEEQLKKMQEKEEESALIEFQSTRRQRKCAIGKQGLLAEISSSDEEYYIKDTATTPRRSTGDKFDSEKSRRQKRESKEKKKERYMEKKHEQIIAKEQKAIEEEILRELELKKEYNAKDDVEMKKSDRNIRDKDNGERPASSGASIAESNNKKSQRSKKIAENSYSKDKNNKDEKFNSDTENKCSKVDDKALGADAGKKKVNRNSGTNSKKEVQVTPTKNSKKSVKACGKSSSCNRKGKNTHGERARSISKDDEELRTTKSWNKVEEGVGVAIGRRKRASTNQLYYWSSSSDDEEEFIQPTPVVEEEDDRQEQHGWIVGDSHKKMITMLAMEKQLKEKRRRSEDEFDSGKSKSKKHRNSTS